MSDGLKSYGEELNSKEITRLDYAMKQMMLGSKRKTWHTCLYMGKTRIGKTEMVIHLLRKTTGPMFIVLLLN